MSFLKLMSIEVGLCIVEVTVKINAKSKPFGELKMNELLK